MLIQLTTTSDSDCAFEKRTSTRCVASSPESASDVYSTTAAAAAEAGRTDAIAVHLQSIRIAADKCTQCECTFTHLQPTVL